MIFLKLQVLCPLSSEIFCFFSHAANIVGHYLAEGKRVLVTSKNAAALDVKRKFKSVLRKQGMVRTSKAHPGETSEELSRHWNMQLMPCTNFRRIMGPIDSDKRWAR
jgi:hypothetical protein